MKDNINNEIHIGDWVFCYSGSLKHTIQRVTGFRGFWEEGNGEERGGVVFKDGFWLSDYNVVSITALGVNGETLDEKQASKQCDALKNPVRVGDKVLYLHPKEMYCEVGTVKSMASKSCLMAVEKNRFGQIEYRKKYEELISLTALNIECIPTRKWNGDVIGTMKWSI